MEAGAVMPTFEEELMGLGSGPSFEDELNALGGAEPAPQQPRGGYGVSGGWDAPQPQGGGLWDSILEGGSDAVRGLNAGLYWGGSDEAEGALNSLAGNGDLSDTVSVARGANAQAEERSPWLYNAGKMAGYVPGMVVGPATAVGRSLLSAGQGAASGLLSSDSDSLDEMASDTLSGGLWGLGGGMAGEGVGAVMRGTPGRDAWQGLRGEADDAGVALRRANAGGTQGELDAIRRNQGIDQMQTGINEDFGQLGLADSGWGGFKPQSAADVYRRIGSEGGPGGIIPAEGQRMGGAIDAAGESGARGDWDSVRQLMDNANRRNMSGAPMPTQGMQTQSAALNRIAENELPPHLAGPAYDAELPGNPEFNPNQATPRELQNQKVAFGKEAYPPADGPLSLISDAPGQAAYQDAYGAVRGELGDVMENAGPSISSMGDDVAAQRYNQDFLGGAQSVQQAAPLGQMAGKRAASNESGGGAWQRALTYGPAAAGGAIGLGVGGVPGMVAGAAAGGAANSLMRNYGQDVAGIGMRNIVSPAMGGIGNVAQYAGQFSGPVGGAAQGGDALDDLAGGDAQRGTRGYLLPQAAQQMMQQPGSLGPYEKQFFDAVNSPDSNALSSLITKLSRTDTQFRTQYLPQLQQLTASEY